MARSRPRKAKVEKVRTERHAAHLDNVNRKGLITLVHDLTAAILHDCPPVLREEPMTVEAIDDLFNSDSDAPVILCALPEDPSDHPSRLRIAVNRHGVERELLARGIGEGHPSREELVDIVGKALRDMTAELLRLSASEVAEGIQRGAWQEEDLS